MISRASRRGCLFYSLACFGPFVTAMVYVFRMTGELHDFSYPDEELWYPSRMVEAGHMMQAALCWLGVYYLCIKPAKLWPPSLAAIHAYDETGLVSRFPYFLSTWREYENLQ